MIPFTQNCSNVLPMISSFQSFTLRNSQLFLNQQVELYFPSINVLNSYKGPEISREQFAFLIVKIKKFLDHLLVTILIVKIVISAKQSLKFLTKTNSQKILHVKVFIKCKICKIYIFKTKATSLRMPWQVFRLGLPLRGMNVGVFDSIWCTLFLLPMILPFLKRPLPVNITTDIAQQTKKGIRFDKSN